MRKLGWLALFLSFLVLGGCSRTPAAKPLEPLTIEQWTVMPPETKFEFEAMERLKIGTPRFQSDEEWDKFAHEVFIPARNREKPLPTQAK